MEVKLTPMNGLDLKNKTVLLRLDINSPIDVKTKKIVNENRIKKSLPTLKYLIEQGAKIAIIAHQGDTLDYQNLIPLGEHAEKLTKLLGREVRYIDDVCGPSAQAAVRALKPGEMVLLGNLRYLSEEISTFETVVKLTPAEMLDTYLVRSLAPIVDVYINDAFAAAHRSAPSMVAFQEIKPTAAGELMFKEVAALTKVMQGPEKPSVFVLGGAKISDAFGMMRQVLQNGTADKILTSGITGEIFLLAKGIAIGNKKEKFIKDRKLDVFIPEAKELLKNYSVKIEMPLDLAYEKNGARMEIEVKDLPAEEMFMDVGEKTIQNYEKIIASAKTIFVNGPAGVYENPLFDKGTKRLWQAISTSEGYSVIGGGDTVTAATKYVDLKTIGYVCTAGGAMVQFLTGEKLPLIQAMEKAYERQKNS